MAEYEINEDLDREKVLKVHSENVDFGVIEVFRSTIDRLSSAENMKAYENFNYGEG